MKSKTRLDSVVFHLTPTRTRCDLVITANGKTEKIASGLLNPFLTHLKEAQEQIGKGGYSIVLEPKPGSDASWFTKGTVERFVRFVSTPEILERVYTIESEILQIEKSISVHVSSENGGHIQAEDLPAKSEDRIEGSKPVSSGNEEKAIVLCQPKNQLQEEDGSTKQEKNSKVQLIQVLQTRKTALEKEQGMAFARAVAASFDIDHISGLISFAECFGASRMMDACKRFVDLWKAKHEVGQWVEVETDGAVASLNASGIMFVNSNEQGDVASENNGILFATGGDIKRGQPNTQERIPAQLSPPMFAPWQMHPQANGMPVFQPYSPRGMPYYQNLPGNNPYYHSPHTPLNDSRKQASRRTRERRHSMDSRDLNADSDTQEIGDDMDMDKDSVSRRRRKTGGKSSRNQSGVVVIRNINYIASADQGSSDGEEESQSDPGFDNEEANLKGDEMRKSKKKGAYSMPNKKGKLPAQVGDDGQWQAFQNFLLKDADEKSNMFEMEGKVLHNKRQHATGDAASVLRGHNSGDNGHVGFSEHHDITGDMTRSRKHVDDQMLSYGQQANLIDVWDSSLDPVIANGISGKSNNKNKGSSHGVLDESSMILKRSGSHDQDASDSRSAMDVVYEHPGVVKKAEDQTIGARSQNYEPNDLNMMPDRMMEDGAGGYDPALDYEMQAQVNKAVNVSGKKEITQDAKQRPRKGVKEQKPKAEKRILTSTRKEKPNKFSPSEDARARADKLRAFKADLQKQKKEKEEEQKRRLEALKMERQKRIAARSGGDPASSSLSSPQARKQLPKLSPVSQKGSKFSDAEPESSSPLQRSTLKFISRIQSDPNRTSMPGKLNFGSPVSGNKLTRSASSSNARKEENNDTTPESKVSSSRIRRLSEPKRTASHISSGKTRSAETVSRRRVSEGSESKKMVAIVNPGKTKSASATESKLRASKGSSVSTQKTSASSEKRSSKMVSGASITANMSVGNAKSSSNRSKENTKISSPNDVNEDTLVDKTVVMLECGKSSKTIKHESEEISNVQDVQSAVSKPGTNLEDDAAVPPPASPIIVKEVNLELVDGQIGTHLNERGASCTEKALPSISNSSTSGRLNQPPYARVSSVEDPCMIKSDYAKVALPTGLNITTPIIETTSVHLPDVQRGDLPNVSEISSGKNPGKEPSKVFRQLFKFGKKNSAAIESNVESSKATLGGSVDDGRTSNATSSEVFTLRNLLIQEESSASVTTPKKSSKSFSLRSLFQSKTRERSSARERNIDESRLRYKIV